ncbi:hypothetical protein EV363DRAFT_1561095 [Boletus edulis]|nr:hypothetical protein EV363DRAFT_1561095 [Boletus edulis]
MYSISNPYLRVCAHSPHSQVPPPQSPASAQPPFVTPTPTTSVGGGRGGAYMAQSIASKLASEKPRSIHSTPQVRQRSLENASRRQRRFGHGARDARRRAHSPLCTPTTSPLTPGISPQMHPPDLAAVVPSPLLHSPVTLSSSPSGLEVRSIPPFPSVYYMPSTNTWLIVYPAPDPEHGFPGARSVHGLVPFVTRTNAILEGIPVALLYHGERDASLVGHAGAGVFWNDAWLLVTSTSTSTPSLEWKKLRVEGTALPEPRGWFPSASYVRDGKTRVVLTGGLLSSNEWSGEVWVRDVEL